MENRDIMRIKSAEDPGLARQVTQKVFPKHVPANVVICTRSSYSTYIKNEDGNTDTQNCESKHKRSNKDRKERLKRKFETWPFNQKGLKPSIICNVKREKPKLSDTKNRICLLCIYEQLGINVKHSVSNQGKKEYKLNYSPQYDPTIFSNPDYIDDPKDPNIDSCYDSDSYCPTHYTSDDYHYDLDSEYDSFDEDDELDTIMDHPITVKLLKLVEGKFWLSKFLKKVLYMLDIDPSIPYLKILSFIGAMILALRINTFTGYIVAFTIYCLTQSNFDKVDILKFGKKLLSMMPKDLKNEDFGEYISNGAALLGDAISSPVLRWIRILITATFSLPFLNDGKLVSSLTKLQMYDRSVLKSATPLPMMLDCLRSIQGLFGVYSSYVKGTQTLSQCFQQSNPYANFNSNYAKVLKYQARTTPLQSKEGFMNNIEYMSLLRVTLEDGERILRSNVSHLTSVRSLVSSQLKDIRDIEAKVTARVQAEGKDAAFIVILVGPPGVGKSVHLATTHSALFHSIGVDFHPDLIGQINVSSNYQDGISNKDLCYHMEEIGVETDFALKNGGGRLNSTNMLLAFGDSAVSLVERSAVEEKGRHFNTAPFVTGCTNFFDLGAKKMTRAPSAIYRRICFVEIRVKEEFCASESHRADKQILKELDNPNIVFQSRFVDAPTLDKNGRMPSVDPETGHFVGSVVSDWLNPHEYTAALIKRSKEHWEQQRIRRETVARTMEGFCEHDAPKNICPLCNEGPFCKHKAFASLCRKCNISDQGLFTKLNPKLVIWDGINSSLRMVGAYVLVVWLMGFEVFFSAIRYHYFGGLARRARDYMDPLAKKYRRGLEFAIRHMLGRHKKNLIDTFIVDQVMIGTDSIITWLCTLAMYFLAFKSVQHIYYSYFSSKISPEGIVMSTNSKINKEYFDEFCSTRYECGRMKPESHEQDYTSHYQTLSLDLGNGYYAKEHMRNIASANVLSFETKGTKFYGTGLCSNFALINDHNFIEGELFTVTRDRGTGTHNVTKGCFQSKNLIRVSSDLSILYLPTMQCRDIRKGMFNSLNGVLSIKGSYKAEFINPVIGNQEIDLRFIKAFKSNTYTRFDNPITYNMKHDFGYCGSPIVITVGNKSYFIGIHCAGSDNDDRLAFGDCLSLELIGSKIEDYTKSLNIPTIANQGSMRKFKIDGEEPIVGPPNRKSILRWRDGNVDYLGSLENLKYNKVRAKMNYLPNCDKLNEVTMFQNKHENGEYKWNIPDTTEHPDPLEEFGYYSPFHKFADKAFNSSYGLDFSLLDFVFRDYQNDYSKLSFPKINPLDSISVVSGDRLNRAIRSMNLKSSMGFGFDGNKIQHTHEFPSDQAPDGQDFSDAVWSDVYECLEIYGRGETVNPVNKASLKMEPRVTTIVKGHTITKQPRVFCATPNSDVIIGRMFLLPVFEFYKRELSTFGCCVGLNATSSDWGRLRQLFEGRYNTTFGTDISGFDTRMPVQVKVIANAILLDLAKRMGYNEESLTVLRGYLTDTLEPIILIKNDLYRMPNLIVSGRVCTAEYNSLCLTIIYRYIYYYIGGELDFGSFSANNSLIVYGDDSKCGTDKQWFNQKSFAEACNLFGIKVTPPDKSSVFGTFFNFDDVEFLHRTWRKDPEHNYWCAPLDTSSMARSLTLNVTSTIGPAMQAFEACHSINFELAQHGRETFDAYMVGLYKHAKSLGCGEPRFKTYDEIIACCYG